MLLKRQDFYNANQLELMPGSIEAEILKPILKECHDFGPFTMEIVSHIWLNHLHKAEAAIKSLLQFGYRFTAERLEEACKRVVFYGLSSPALVEAVLFEHLDSLPLDHSTDIYGQYKLF